MTRFNESISGSLPCQYLFSIYSWKEKESSTVTKGSLIKNRRKKIKWFWSLAWILLFWAKISSIAMGMGAAFLLLHEVSSSILYSSLIDPSLYPWCDFACFLCFVNCLINLYMFKVQCLLKEKDSTWLEISFIFLVPHNFFYKLI